MQIVGSVRPTPSPSSKIAGEMLNVLSAFGGGDKKLRALLEKIEENQKYNENVIEQAQAARSDAIHQQRTAQVTIDSANRLKSETDFARKTFEDNRNKEKQDIETHTRDIIVRENVLQREIAAFETRVKQQIKEGDARLRELEKHQGYVERRESQITAMTEAFREHVQAITSAYSRVGELRAAVNGLDEWIRSTEK